MAKEQTRASAEPTSAELAAGGSAAGGPAAGGSARWIIRHAGLTDRGLVRAGNEDAWAADPGLGLYVVADGMGGHACGEEASKIVVESLPELVRRRLGELADLSDPSAARRFRGVLARLSRDVYRRAQERPALRGMGATVVAVLLRGRYALVAHLGDSRAYLLRGGRLRSLTRDHSIVQQLIDSGELDPADAARHPARHCITRNAGMAGQAEPDSKRLPLRAGDRLLLCSDGLNGMLGDEEVGRIVAGGEGPPQTCRELIDAANRAGGVDNITAVVIEIAAHP